RRERKGHLLEGDRYIRMVRPQDGATDGERFALKGLGLLECSDVAENGSEVAEADRQDGVRAISEQFPADGERLAMIALGLIVGADMSGDRTEVTEVRGHGSAPQAGATPVQLQRGQVYLACLLVSADRAEK